MESMKRACRVLEGERDFAPFTNQEGAKRNTVRRVKRASVKNEGQLIYFDVEANSFLAQQMRRMVGALVKVGSAEMGVNEFEEIADCGEVGRASTVAPAHGLCLTRVDYTEIGFGHENV